MSQLKPHWLNSLFGVLHCGWTAFSDSFLRVLSDRNLDWSLTWPFPGVTGWICRRFCWHTWVMTPWQSYKLSFQVLSWAAMEAEWEENSKVLALALIVSHFSRIIPYLNRKQKIDIKETKSDLIEAWWILFYLLSVSIAHGFYWEIILQISFTAISNICGVTNLQLNYH